MALFRGKEIVVIVDTADLMMQIRQVLEADGALLEEARTVRSALASASENLPHLIIADLNVTGGGALQFLAEVKKLPMLAKIPVLNSDRPAKKRRSFARRSSAPPIVCSSRSMRRY